MATPEDMLDAIDSAVRVPVRTGGMRLDEWETSFVESVREQVHRGRTLSTKQLAKLEDIWDKT